jgi:hypothetical protein
MTHSDQRGDRPGAAAGTGGATDIGGVRATQAAWTDSYDSQSHGYVERRQSSAGNTTRVKEIWQLG